MNPTTHLVLTDQTKLEPLFFSDRDAIIQHLRNQEDENDEPLHVESIVCGLEAAWHILHLWAPTGSLSIEITGELTLTIRTDD